MIIFSDFDGVLTDNTSICDCNGRQMIRCNKSDGWAISQILADGHTFISITGDLFGAKIEYAKRLDFKIVKSKNKLETITNILKTMCEPWNKVIYIGNDKLDLECLEKAIKDGKWAFVPNDSFVFPHGCIRLERNGGQGVIREVYEYIK